MFTLFLFDPTQATIPAILTPTLAPTVPNGAFIDPPAVIPGTIEVTSILAPWTTQRQCSS